MILAKPILAFCRLLVSLPSSRTRTVVHPPIPVKPNLSPTHLSLPLSTSITAYCRALELLSTIRFKKLPVSKPKTCPSPSTTVISKQPQLYPPLGSLQYPQTPPLTNATLQLHQNPSQHHFLSFSTKATSTSKQPNTTSSHSQYCHHLNPILANPQPKP